MGGEPSMGGDPVGGSASGGGAGDSSGGNSGTGGEASEGGCVDEVTAYYLRDDGTVWDVSGGTNPQFEQILLEEDESPLDGVVDITSGSRFGCAVDTEGAAWCWSGDGSPDNSQGQLGNNTPAATYVDFRATRVLRHADAGDPVALSGVQSLSQGSDECRGTTSCAITEGGALWCWGAGTPNTLNSLSSGTLSRIAVPIHSEADVPLTGVDQVSELVGHMCVVASEKVYCWGTNPYGELGTGDTTTSMYPQEVTLPGPALKVGAGVDSTCALLEDGTVWCWGSNRYGQLGIGDPEEDDDGCAFPCKTAPVQVMTADGPLAAVSDLAVGARSITSAGATTACALLSDHSIWCWGRDRENVAARVVGTNNQLVSGAVQLSMCGGDPSYVTDSGDIIRIQTNAAPEEVASICP